MKLERVLVVYKRTAYEYYCEEERDARILQLVSENHFTVQDMLKSHQEHRETMEKVGTALEDLRIPNRFVRRADVRETQDQSLVITVGGDGTFLDASHHVRETPMLGVNSSPSSSVGVFCGATGKTLKNVLGDIIKDKIKPVPVNRICVLLNGKAIQEPALNEALICAQHPATTARYVVDISKKKEHQKSSGIYIGPAAGSTAAIRAAGGQLLPIVSKRVQYVVREPYRGPGTKSRMVRGFVPPRGGMRIWSKMRDGMIYLDGMHVRYRFNFGDELQILPEFLPLPVYALSSKRR